MGTYIVLGLLSVVVVLAARSVYRTKKNGGCAGGCAGCPGSCHCRDREAPHSS